MKTNDANYNQTQLNAAVYHSGFERTFLNAHPIITKWSCSELVFEMLNHLATTVPHFFPLRTEHYHEHFEHFSTVHCVFSGKCRWFAFRFEKFSK